MRRAPGIVVAVSIISLAGGRAHAQASDSTALAEQLFNQARDLAKANQWAEACPKFEASLRYDPVLGTRLNLATCYEHVGKLASAWALYREAIEIARKAGDTKRGDYAQKQATALEPRLPRLAISAPAAAPAGLTVKRDGTLIDPGGFGVGLYVDPGAHTVTAAAPGFQAFTQTVTLVEGKTETLAIPALVKQATSPVAVTPVKAVVAADGPRPRPTRKYIGLGVGATGVVAVGVGLLFGAKANSTYGDAEKLCGSSLACKSADLARGKQLVSDARSSATVSTVFVIGGVAALAAGALVYLTAPHAAERTTAHLVPVPHDGGAGLALVGAF